MWPGIPKHDQRETEHQKQNQSSVIHYCLGSDSGQNNEVSTRIDAGLRSVGRKRLTKKSGNWIIPARMPGMATPDSPHGQPQTPEQAVTPEGFHRILRTTRVKTTAAPQHGTDRNLVGAYQQQARVDQRRSHRDSIGRRFKRSPSSLRQTLR